MVNFGYPYNDLVICKDSTDYLVCAPEIRIVEIKNGKYDNEMCELPCNVIITVKKGNIVYKMHNVSHEILIPYI